MTRVASPWTTTPTVYVRNPEQHQLFTRLKEISLYDKALPPSATRLSSLERVQLAHSTLPANDQLSSLLSKLHTLRELELSGRAFTDRFLNNLHPRARLRQLTLSYTSVSEPRLAKFHSDYPDVEVVVVSHDKPGQMVEQRFWNQDYTVANRP